MSASLTKNRIESIDLLKGLVMVIMALDHVRDYFHFSAFYFDPGDPQLSNLYIFFTRWITHFCAPTFSFLAGLSAFMVSRRKTKDELSGYLFKRGIWLVFIELTVVTFAWFFDVQFRTFLFGVIWSLGLSLIVLSILVRFPMPFILGFSLIVIFGHNLLDGIPSNGNMLWEILHVQAFRQVNGDINLLLAYPLIPWIAVMSLGYYFGTFYESAYLPEKRKKLFNSIGWAAIVLFIVLRYTGWYGNSAPWTDLNSLSANLISFLNPDKYPPSLLYLLMTLGGSLIVLANTETLRGKAVQFLSTFGRVPFFYYILHLYLIHLLALIFAELSGFGWQLMILPTWVGFAPGIQGFGVSLFPTYLIWIAVIVILYPMCKWFDTYKMNHREKWWLSYL